MKFLVLVNFKAYKEGVGKKGLELAREIDRLRSFGYQLGICPQLVDLKEICRIVKIPVFAQHVDGIELGKHTGWVLPEGVKLAGAKGTLLNHSERKVERHELEETIKRCKKVGLKQVVCVGSLAGVRKVVRFKPDYVAYEPERLIGKDISVTSANPEIILRAVEVARRERVKLLVGAGIHSKEDIMKAEELGADGVLLAHKVVKAKKVGKVLEGLLG